MRTEDRWGVEVFEITCSGNISLIHSYELMFADRSIIKLLEPITYLEYKKHFLQSKQTNWSTFSLNKTFHAERKAVIAVLKVFDKKLNTGLMRRML